jgi:hypothetical protein
VLDAAARGLALAVESVVAAVEAEDLVLGETDALGRLECSVQRTLCCDQEFGTRVLQLVRQLSRHVSRVGTAEDPACHDRSDQDDGEEDGVAGVQQQSVAILETSRSQTCCEPLRPFAVGLVREAVGGLVGIEEDRLVVEFVVLTAEEVGREGDIGNVNVPA